MRESLRRLASEEAMEARGRGGGGTRRVRVELLDTQHLTLDFDRKSRGSDLLDRVCDELDVHERDYFGLLHTQRGDCRVWIDLNRRLSKTFRNEPWDAKLAVKFYPPVPSDMRDDNARYQVALAVRRDLIEGRLTCSTITMALMASYAVQAECGDHAGRTPNSTCAQLVPLAVLTPDLMDKIDELHRKHNPQNRGRNLRWSTCQLLEVLGQMLDRFENAAFWWRHTTTDVSEPGQVDNCAENITGQTPAEAELSYLENAVRLPLYGAEQHAVKDSDGGDITLAIAAPGVSVFREGIQLNRFPWAKIIKICYKKRAFILHLRASEFDEFETHLTFLLPSTRACKKLWRCSVEHHIFLRREAPVKVERIIGFPRLGSRRLSCRRTLRQLRAEPTAPGVAA